MTGGTDWSRYAVPDIAGVMDEDLSTSWQQVSAWTATADMITSSRWILATARAELASGWPPETSDAAAHFFKVVDSVIGYMSETENATRTNAATLTHVLNSMTETKEAIDQLYSTWHMYQEQIREAPTLLPSGVGVPNGWSADLNSRAHVHMTTMDQVAFDAARTLITPSDLPQALSQVATVPIEILKPIPTNGKNGVPGGGSSSHGSPTLTGSTSPVLTGGQPSASTHSPITAGSESRGQSGSGSLLGAPEDGSSAPEVPGRDANNHSSDAWHDSRNPTSGLGRQLMAGTSAPDQDVTVASTRSPWTVADASSTSELAVEPLRNGQVASGVMIPPSLGSADRTKSRGQRMYLDTTWFVPEGVPSILIAALDSDVHDPGPGVIGIDL